MSDSAVSGDLPSIYGAFLHDARLSRWGLLLI